MLVFKNAAGLVPLIGKWFVFWSVGMRLFTLFATVPTCLTEGRSRMVISVQPAMTGRSRPEAA
jgi:hypothetical protein